LLFLSATKRKAEKKIPERKEEKKNGIPLLLSINTTSKKTHTKEIQKFFQGQLDKNHASLDT